MSDPDGSPALFPVPRAVEWPDRPGTTHADVRVVVDPSLPPQGYEVTVDGDGVMLRHAGDAGRRYGEQTLEQLRRPDGALPHVRVTDHPDVATRGVMLDVSRDRVPTRPTLARLVDLMDRCRFNHLQLYVEHTFAYRDHADVWRDASPITAEDLTWLDDLCVEHGIELAANQNCFGHMGRWLALDRYRLRAECPEGVELVPGLTWPPGVLAPTAENADWVVSLVREQADLLRSRTVNVGCDETFELGRGASAERAAAEGVGEVYLEQLRRIVDPLLADGRRVQFWGDVVAHHPEVASRLPTGELTALVWNYESPHRPHVDVHPLVAQVMAELGVDLDAPTDFATLLTPFRDAGVDAWVVPGTSSWNSFVGRLDNARENLLDAAIAARDHAVDGFLVADWGDNGHHQPPSVSDPPLMYGAAVAWCADTNADLDLVGALDRFHRDRAGELGAVLVEIGSVAGRTGAAAYNVSPLVPPLVPEVPDLSDGRADPDAVRTVVAELDRAASALGRSRPDAPDGDVTVEELDVAIGLARQGALRLLDRLGASATTGEERREEMSALVRRYRDVWLERSRPGGLDDSARRLERAIDR